MRDWDLLLKVTIEAIRHVRFVMDDEKCQHIGMEIIPWDGTAKQFGSRIFLTEGAAREQAL